MLRPTKNSFMEDSQTDAPPATISGHDELEADPHNSPKAESQVDESPSQSSDSVPWMYTETCGETTQKNHPHSLWTEVMLATGEDINTGKPCLTDYFQPNTTYPYPTK